MAGTATGNAIQSTVAGAGSGTVTSVTAADTSIVTGGTPGVAITLATGTLDVIANDHPPAANWSNNTHKITSLANGTAASDAAAFGQIPLVDSTAADIQANGNVAAGSNGLWADSGHVHPSVTWTYADSGVLAANITDPLAASNTALTIAGTLYLLRVNIYKAITWTNVLLAVTAAGNNTGGSTGTFVGLYNSAGTLLTGSLDVAASLTTAGTRTLALTTPQALSAGTFVWVAILTNLGTTQPTLARSGAAVNTQNFNLAAASFRVAVNGTGLTALPPSITPGSNTGTNSLSFLVGAS